MSIQPVGQPGLFCCPLKQNVEVKQPSINKQERNFQVVSYPKEYYVSFSGGKSLNLSQTYEQIQKMGAFPEGIEDRIKDTLSNGNPDNKTLKDIHSEKYSDLYCCDTIEELRAFFPEFDGVKTDSEFQYTDNPNMSEAANKRTKAELDNLIQKVKAGEFEDFSKSEDVGLQLTKMYWADGLSQDDIAKKLNAPNIYISELFKGFNIPSKDKLYGYYLKMSDADVNQVVSKKISDARLNTASQTASAKFQTIIKDKLAGKPVKNENIENLYGQLQAYYNNHPNIPYSYTAQDYKYFAKHPTQAIVFNQVVQNAFRNDKMAKLDEDLKKYLGKDKLTLDDFIQMSAIEYSKNQKMQDFWTDKHKNIFDGCMKDAMRHQKYLDSIGELYEPLQKVPLLGNDLINDMNKIFKKEGPHDFALEQAQYLCYHDASLGDGSTPEQKKALDWVTKCFAEHPEIQDKYSATLQVVHFKAAAELVKAGRLDLAAEVLATLSYNGDAGIGSSYHKILDNHIDDSENIIAPLFNTLLPQASKFVYKSSEEEYSKYEKSTTSLIKKLGQAGYYKMKTCPDGLIRLYVDNTVPEAKKRMQFYVLDHPTVALGFSKEDAQYFKEHPEEKKYFFEAVHKAWASPFGAQIKENFLKHVNYDENYEPWLPEDTEYVYEALVEDNDDVLEEFFKSKPENKQIMMNCLADVVRQEYRAEVK